MTQGTNDPKIIIGFITYGNLTAEYLPYFLNSLKVQIYKNYNIIAIDNMPSFFPMEASLSFSEQLHPLLLQLYNAKIADTPWARSEALFLQHIS